MRSAGPTESETPVRCQQIALVPADVPSHRLLVRMPKARAKAKQLQPVAKKKPQPERCTSDSLLVGELGPVHV